MKKYIFIIIIVALMGVGLLFIVLPSKKTTCNAQSCNNSTQTAKNPVAIALEESSTNKAVIIDVRTPEEYATGHSKNAINFDLNNLNAGQIPELAKDTKIYVYCRSGNRSNQAKIALNNNGFTNVIDLGGLDKMKAGGAL